MVVDFSGGCEQGVSGLLTEAIAAMFAVDLELPVPEPLLVRVESDLMQSIPNDEVRAMGAPSAPIALGSRLLRP